MIRTISLPLAVLAVGSLGRAQVTTIPQFSGQASDGFETQHAAGMSGFQPCLIGRAFNNTADFCTPGGSAVNLTSGWSFGCQIAPHGGTYFLGSTGGGYMELSFDTPVTRFGGFFGTNTPNATTVAVRFYDAGSNQIDNVQLSISNDCLWVWNGWETQGAAIASIQVENSSYGGGFVMFDDCEVDSGPTVIGSSYCLAGANSMDANGALISAQGSTSLSAASLELIAAPAPSQPFTFLYGPDRMSLAFGNGFRCVGGITQNLGVATGQFGEMRHQIDFAAHGANLATLGTVNFQCWYRDPAAGGAFFNLSNGLEVVFTP